MQKRAKRKMEAAEKVNPMISGLSEKSLFFMGAGKLIITYRNWIKSRLEMLTISAIAAGSAYIIGTLISIIKGSL